MTKDSYSNFEKFVTGFAFLAGSLVVAYRFLKFGFSDMTMNSYVLGLGGLFIARKGLSYFKPELYYANTNQKVSDQAAEITKTTTNVV